MYHFELKCGFFWGAGMIAPMRRVAASFLPPIALAERTKTPMYRQLYDWFRKAIIEGSLRPGQRVPSTRGLAVELNISRIPVVNAYAQLHTEGYFETFVGAGTCVADLSPTRAVVSRLSERGEGRRKNTPPGPGRFALAPH